MARPKLITKLLIEQVALLASEGKSQAEIKAILGVSQATVSRALALARTKKILEDRPVCRLGAERSREVKEMIYAQGLTARLQAQQPSGRRHLREVHIVDIGKQSGRSQASHDRRLRAFGRATSGYFARSILPRVEKLGVTWGATLLHLVNETKDREDLPDERKREERKHIDFLPVCGDPPETHLDALLSASNLVAQLDHLWHGGGANRFNFLGVAASISRDFNDAEARVLRRFFGTIPGYRRVFGSGRSSPGEIGKVDCILTSVGSNRAAEAPWLGAAAEAAGVEPDRLARLTHGNVAGLFLPRRSLERGGKKTVDDINGRWTGIQLKHFLACARAAASGERVGVVIVASGDKADILLECIRLGLVSVLVVDQHLAAALAARLEARAA